MLSGELLSEAYGRVGGVVRAVLRQAGPAVLEYRADPEANSIAWLVWHLTRVQDGHVSELLGEEELWTKDGWAARFDLPFSDSETGYGQTADQVGGVRASADLLGGYFDAVHARTLAYLPTLTPEDLDRIVDTSWNPPVTLGARLVSVLADDLQHAGQAAFVRGLAVRSGA
ncbi:DUF664 domain-containing protein [Cryobacterium breve]|uniref:DUF664 domain-containing protein n=1 Tax=Cryobacterium breve TaxID=1259258 RepID=A0ABY7NE25_9MICO|nr:MULTISPECIES: DinB family protein [Cryobacterium]MDY7544385.1 DinB family protein [Cryobacterium sp. 5B3]MEA9998786.1 DinB family protein [Cryobacterium sp. RTS3]MEB0266256.1 DinB family protein [Cryobacterium sp. 10I5]MEB0274161.1 DinB family protein [Cryobacterium sp. 5B3]WBM80711.1 DUF664 domain-containing protein [Cryobacterium breve]